MARASAGTPSTSRTTRLHYVYSFVGLMEQKIDATEDIPRARM